MVRVIRMGLEYEGTRYHGFALQPGLPTVQLVVERALADLIGSAVRVTPAGRTDAGVHAIGQVLSFRTESRLPAEAISRALGSRLPEDVVAGPSDEAEAGFDARRSALRRHYRYTIWNNKRPNLWWRRYSLHVADRLDESAMREAAAALVGRHDFASFVGHAAQEPRRSSAVRTVQRADWIREGDLLHFDCCADAFARHMVRNMVGTLLSVGCGRTSAQEFERVLEAQDRRAAGPTAAASGLTLVKVDYDEHNAGAISTAWAGARRPPDNQEGQT